MYVTSYGFTVWSPRKDTEEFTFVKSSKTSKYVMISLSISFRFLSLRYKLPTAMHQFNVFIFEANIKSL